MCDLQVHFIFYLIAISPSSAGISSRGPWGGRSKANASTPFLFLHAKLPIPQNRTNPRTLTPPIPPSPLLLLSPPIPPGPNPPARHQIRNPEPNRDTPHGAPHREPPLPALPPPHGQHGVQAAPRGGHGGRVAGVAREVDVRGEEEGRDEEDRGAEGARVQGDDKRGEDRCGEGVRWDVSGRVGGRGTGGDLLPQVWMRDGTCGFAPGSASDGIVSVVVWSGVNTYRRNAR